MRFLLLQLQKYTAYVGVLSTHLDKYKPRSNSVTESIAEEPATSNVGGDESIHIPGSRASYRLAIYSTEE